MDIRIQHLMEIFVQTFGIPTFEIVQKYDYQTVCQVSMSYGKIIDSFSAGWPISEVYNVYDYLFGNIYLQLLVLKLIVLSFGIL